MVKLQSIDRTDAAPSFPRNNPGHDPNPNARRCFWQNGFDPNAANQDVKHAHALAILLEMGFSDVATCKRLLEETNGDVKRVVLMLSGIHRE